MQNILLTFFEIIKAILDSPQLLFIVISILFLLKLSLLIYLTHRIVQNSKAPQPIYFSILILFASLICDTSWLLTPFSHLIDYRVYNAFIRIAWAFTILFYQSLALFIESLAQQKKQLSLRQYTFLTLTSILFIFYIGIAIIDYNCAGYNDKWWIEKFMFIPASVYSLLSLILSSFMVFRRLQINYIPRILAKQIRLFVLGIILPFWFTDVIQIISLILSPITPMAAIWINKSYAFATLSHLLLIYALFYSMRRIMGLRFLNLKQQVQAPINLNFINNLKTILERLSHVTNQEQLDHITQGFFKETYNIPFNKVKLYIREARSADQAVGYAYPHYQIASLIETFLSTQSEAVHKEIYNQKILIYDEITFNNFYEQLETRNIILHFLQHINADVFLPIYEKESMLAYIVIESGARIDTFYSEAEHDEMLIFSNYLGNIINLLKKQDLDILIAQEKNLSEELYRKHQEVNQYKESIRSFIRSPQQKAIGIVFYKNRLFTFANQAAKEMIKINLNIQQGHSLARAFRYVAQHVEEYKVPQTAKASDADGNSVILTGVPNLEGNNCIITISYPDISDVLKHHIDMLHDPSERDYLLYLETTKSGKLINQLIPGSGEQLLKFKIELLKMALSKRATLLTIPEQDLPATVDLLHRISLRETFHTINLRSQCTNATMAITLFGINPIFDATNRESPLCERLSDTGTVFIKNIHFLDLETQRHLAELIRYGLYRPFKGEHKEHSNIRIICSTDRSLPTLVQEGKFSHELFNQLKESCLSMPPLTALSREELGSLTEGFTEQVLTTSTFKNLLTLTDKDKVRIANQRPSSLYELKKRVHHIIERKSQHHELQTEPSFDPVHQIHNADPALAEIARLGKQALKNKDAMLLLWNTFHNQNQIATFLGVNRSSVNRRCKKYNLI